MGIETTDNGGNTDSGELRIISVVAIFIVIVNCIML